MLRRDVFASALATVGCLLGAAARADSTVSSAGATGAGSVQDRAAIDAVLRDYLSVMDQQSEASIAKAFHPQALLMSVTESGELNAMTQATWWRRISRPGIANSGRTSTIRHIDVVGVAAVARVDVVRGENRSTDFFTLLRFENGWRIVNKVVSSVIGAAAARPAVAEEIRAALADWRDASNRGDWRRAASHYAPGALIEFPGRPDYSHGQMMRNVERPPTVTWRHDFEIVEMLVDETLAVVRVNFSSEQRQPDDGWKPGESIETVQTWRLQSDGRWRIARSLSGKLP
jgi:ketosteroid isomerase-like protein